MSGLFNALVALVRATSPLGQNQSGAGTAPPPIASGPLEPAQVAGVVVAATVVALFLVAAVRLVRKKRADLGAPPETVSDEEIERELEAEAGSDDDGEGEGEGEGEGGSGGNGATAAESPAPAPAATPDNEKKKAAYRAKKEERRAEQERRRAEDEDRRRGEEEERRRAAEEERRRQAADAAEKTRREQAIAGRTLAEGLERTRGGFVARLQSLFAAPRPVDERTLAQLEEILFGADIGVKTATRLVQLARDRHRAAALDAGALRSAIREEVGRILAFDGVGGPPSARPHVVMVVGVNGGGKTTTIGKLAAMHAAAGRRVILAAADTFRAAATEQLEVWAQRAAAPLVKGREGADPGAVAYNAVQRARAEQFDVVIADTAGRLHTQVPLMDELRKVKRVLGKAMEGAPHEVLLVLDATTGQNAIAQARQFHDTLGVTGIALSKLDGTAKGGVVIGICDELRIPVRYVGVGEGVADLRRFEAAEFVRALFEA